jgi:MoaA/NifB/PqqE/SkfB family radical SAM enzyme
MTESYVVPRSSSTGAAARNAALNREERAAGRSRLVSKPPRLRVTLERRCDLHPRCVYCEWDWAKDRERRSGRDLTPEMLRHLGSFYDLAEEIVDCSHGEPLLNPHLADLVEEFDRRGKHFEMTTHGQALTDRRRRAVLGRRMALYVSVDAATPEAYARYRNDRFDRLVENLLALGRERRRHGNLPTLILSFLAMRSNLGEFAGVLDLAGEIGADAVKVRTLHADGLGIAPEVVRGGHAFRYREEILDRDALATFAASARRLGEAKGIPLFIDRDDFQRETREADGPLCTEPFETLYLLNRGIMPCAFAKEPLAAWQDVALEDLERHLAQVFNDPGFRELREALAEQRLPAYCCRFGACPIVRRFADGPTTT